MIETILILGMHRSGTSCLTGCLKSYGLQLGEVSEYNKNNLKGNQENRQVFRLNEAVFEFNDGSWHTPPELPLQLNDQLKARQSEVLQNYNSLAKPWGIKDPRMLFAYGFWQDVLPQHQLVGTFRHPLAVANSLAARKKLCIPLDQGLQLWKQYNQQLLKLLDENPFPVLDFDWPEPLYIERVHNLAKSLGLQAPADESFFDANLKNQSAYSRSDCPDDLLSTFDALRQASERMNHL